MEIYGHPKDVEFIQNGCKFCVECGREKPLNKCGVCENCWDEDRIGEAWELHNF